MTMPDLLSELLALLEWKPLGSLIDVFGSQPGYAKHQADGQTSSCASTFRGHRGSGSVDLQYPKGPST